jgi:glycerophosphoryl diester phosphodiesterase
MRVREVHLDEGHARLLELRGGVAERVAVVGERRRVQHDGQAPVDRLVKPGDQLRLVVALPHVDGHVVGHGCREPGLDVRERLAAVHLGFARAETAEVRAVEDEDGGGHSASLSTGEQEGDSGWSLVARHENEISGTTDVASRTQFAARKATKTIDGASVTGWFIEDFTLAELKTLRAIERLPQVRPQNTAFNGLSQVPTLDEVIDLARHSVSCQGEPIGVYPETKHPKYFDTIGLSLEEPLVAQLRANGVDDADDPVIVQSFEVSNLKELDGLTDVALAQLVNSSGRPYDFALAGDARTHADLVTDAGLAEVASYADGIGIEKSVAIPRNADGTLGTATPVIADAHAAGLDVHGWTFRRENAFLPAEFRSSADPAGIGDLAGEIRVFVDAGLDGLFSDNPDVAID